ncbi:hypothetical protein HYC85_006240 [Camellia sinensis]|uniref:Uncharacterized protein n=1 Tax=Camellia sinensis TaxID=4442 RepID=A0A7J7HN33_CAMSI|nr:hypothetical protein HYC85_006240 [Camellia sinensis]
MVASCLKSCEWTTQTLDDYAHNDPIFSKHGKLHLMPYIKRDMLMLENQLPMPVLHNLLAVENRKADQQGNEEEEFVNKLILSSATPTPGRAYFGKTGPTRKKKAGNQAAAQTMKVGGGDEIIRSATELNEAGIRFKKSKSGSLKDISFKGGVLKLPLIVVDDATESMFLNLMAFERFHVGSGNEVTSYIFFMDNIIDSAGDVSLLHSRSIIQNAIGSDKAVAKLFNSLSKDITLDPDSSLDVVHKKVHRYCKKHWNEWRANLIHTYFRNPWAILSVLLPSYFLPSPLPKQSTPFILITENEMCEQYTQNLIGPNM